MQPHKTDKFTYQTDGFHFTNVFFYYFTQSLFVLYNNVLLLLFKWLPFEIIWRINPVMNLTDDRNFINRVVFRLLRSKLYKHITNETDRHASSASFLSSINVSGQVDVFLLQIFPDIVHPDLPFPPSASLSLHIHVHVKLHLGVFSPPSFPRV